MGSLSLTSVLLLAAVVSNPPDANPHDELDLLEVNHYHDDQGRMVFDQLIFYEWSPEQGRHQVRAWRLLKSDTQRPRYDFPSRQYVVRWYDGEILREVRAAAYRETWTQHDPELAERQFLAKEKRKELSAIMPVKRKTKPENIAGITP